MLPRYQPKISARTRATTVTRPVSFLAVSRYIKTVFDQFATRKFSDITDTMKMKEDSAEKAYVMKHEEEVLAKLKQVCFFFHWNNDRYFRLLKKNKEK